MSDRPLMPKATAVWLIDNTGLTFDQIAAFCRLHLLEVKGIADGDVAGGVRGIDPVTQNQLTREEIEKGEADETYRLQLSRPKTDVSVSAPGRKKASRYTPVSMRQNRPNAIAWLVRNHPEITDAQISKLLGTTKSTIQTIRDRSHWNYANLEPQDPVGLGFCSQLDLDLVVAKSAQRKKTVTEPEMDEGPALQPAQPAADRDDHSTDYLSPEQSEDLDADQVFANFNTSDK